MNKKYETPDLNNIKMIDVGSYAYKGGDTYYNQYCAGYEWGYGVLEWTSETAYYYHVKPARTYTSYDSANDTEADTIEFAETIQDRTRFVFNTGSN